MNDSIVAVTVFLAFGLACYTLGRAHQPEKPWQLGYRQGVADNSKAIFKTAVRAAVNRDSNSTPHRFKQRLPTAFGRVVAKTTDPGRHAKDEHATFSTIHDETTVVVNFRPRGNPTTAADTKAGAEPATTRVAADSSTEAA